MTNDNWKFKVAPGATRNRSGKTSHYWIGKHSFGVNFTLRWWYQFRGLKLRLAWFVCRIGWFRVGAPERSTQT